MADAAEGFGEIHGGGCSTKGRFLMIEATDKVGSQWDQCKGVGGRVWSCFVLGLLGRHL